MRAPGGAVPDLEVVVDPGHDDLLPQPGVLAERCRHHHPALLVQLGLCRARVEVPVHQPPFPAERIELAQPRLNARLPLAPGVGGETPLDPPREDDPVGKRRTELRRKRETVLVIDRMLVLAYQHGPPRTTLNHLFPLRNPPAAISHRPPHRRFSRQWEPCACRRSRSSMPSTGT